MLIGNQTVTSIVNRCLFTFLMKMNMLQDVPPPGIYIIIIKTTGSLQVL